MSTCLGAFGLRVYWVLGFWVKSCWGSRFGCQRFSLHADGVKFGFVCA